MSIKFDDDQKKAIDEIVERRLQRERGRHAREIAFLVERHERELERVRLELRTERSLLTRIRDWLST
jgi:hypothetical protein